jgi:hypothetical protein
VWRLPAEPQHLRDLVPHRRFFAVEGATLIRVEGSKFSHSAVLPKGEELPRASALARKFFGVFNRRAVARGSVWGFFTFWFLLFVFLVN